MSKEEDAYTKEVPEGTLGKIEEFLEGITEDKAQQLSILSAALCVKVVQVSVFAGQLYKEVAKELAKKVTDANYESICDKVDEYSLR